MSRRRWLVALAAMAVLLLPAFMLTACTEASGVGSPLPVASTTAPTVPQPTGSALASRKAAAGIVDCPTSDPSVPAVEGGLPDVVLTCLGGGRPVRLAGLRGRPLVLNVWAQWCPPCRTEAPYLSDVAAGNRSDLLFLGVDYVDPQPDLALEFAQRSRWRYPQVADTDRALGGPLQIAGPPQTFLVRADGTIAYRHAGAFTSADQLRGLVRRYLQVEL